MKPNFGLPDKSLCLLSLSAILFMQVALILGGCVTTPTEPPPPPACDGNPNWCINVVVEPGYGLAQTGLLGGLLFYVDGVGTVLNNPGKTTIEVSPGNHSINYCIDHEGFLSAKRTKCEPGRDVNIISNWNLVLPGPP